MSQLDLSAVPDPHRETVASALVTTFGPGGVTSVAAVPGGASGALTYRVEARTGAHLLRLETIRGPLRNPHQYDCMQIAAEAGIAPPIRFVDADAGVVVMPFLAQRPLTDFPGGPPALAAAGGTLLARVHRTPTFPALGDYLENLARMLAYLERSGRVAPGLLAQHTAGFERIRSAYPWQPDEFGSAHNDPNQFNLLYDGDRLWLIDWETASRNDPLVDVGIACGYLAPTPDLRDIVLRSWLGHEPDESVRARLLLIGLLTQLWSGSILLTAVVDPATPTHTDLTPMSVDDFRIGIERGDLRPGTPSTTHAYAKIVLRGFIDSLSTPELDHALQVTARNSRRGVNPFVTNVIDRSARAQLRTARLPILDAFAALHRERDDVMIRRL